MRTLWKGVTPNASQQIAPANRKIAPGRVLLHAARQDTNWSFVP
jgi:hypothetical protein